MSTRLVRIEEGDLPAIAELLATVESGIGARSDPLIRSGIRGLSGRAGSWGLAEQMRNPGGTSEAECGRTFIWLAAAATLAVERGDALLPMRIFYLANFFEEHVQPHISMADGDDMRVSLVPSDAMGEILSAGLAALPRLGPDATRVVLEFGSTPVEAWMIGKMLGDRAIQPRSRRSIPPDLLELAEQLAAMPGPSS